MDNKRASEEQQDVAREDMEKSLRAFRQKAGGSLFGTFVAHVASPEGKPIRDFGAMVDAASGGLLSKAIKGIMTPDEKKSDITVRQVPNSSTSSSANANSANKKH